MSIQISALDTSAPVPDRLAQVFNLALLATCRAMQNQYDECEDENLVNQIRLTGICFNLRKISGEKFHFSFFFQKFSFVSVWPKHYKDKVTYEKTWLLRKPVFMCETILLVKLFYKLIIFNPEFTRGARQVWPDLSRPCSGQGWFVGRKSDGESCSHDWTGENRLLFSKFLLLQQHLFKWKKTIYRNCQMSASKSIHDRFSY